MSNDNVTHYPPVYRLDTNAFSIERLDTTGNKPGWISEHRAIPPGAQEIEIREGNVRTLAEGQENHSPNTSVFVLDVERLIWRVKE